MKCKNSKLGLKTNMHFPWGMPLWTQWLGSHKIVLLVAFKNIIILKTQTHNDLEIKMWALIYIVIQAQSQLLQAPDSKN